MPAKNIENFTCNELGLFERVSERTASAGELKRIYWAKFDKKCFS